jgi:HD superfamily phosphohydrolase
MKVKEYNQMMAYLTRPKDKFKKVKKEITVPGPLEQLTEKTEKEILNDPNILRRIKYLSKTYDDIDLGKDFDKAIAQEDKQLAKLGRDPMTILQRNNIKKFNNNDPSTYPSNPDQRRKLLAQQKLEKEKPIKKKAPIINLVEIPKYQPTDFKLPEPDPQTKALEENFNRIRKETEDEKRRMRTSGLAGLMGGDNE